MRYFIDQLKERNVKKYAAFIVHGSWLLAANKIAKADFEDI